MSTTIEVTEVDREKRIVHVGRRGESNEGEGVDETADANVDKPADKKNRRPRRTKDELARVKQEKLERKARSLEKRSYREEIKLGHYKKKVFDITSTERVDDETWRVLEALCPTRRVLLQYSTGKDSTAAWFELRERGFTVVPFFKETFRGMSFFDDVIKAHEDFFQTEILIVPNPVAFNERVLFFTGEDDRCSLGLEGKRLLDEASFSKAGIRAFRQKTVDHLLDLTDTDVCIIGTKASDSLHRRTHFRVDGPYTPRDRIMALCWRLSKNAPLRIMIENKIPIPKYYLWLGRSPDLFLENEYAMIKKYYPADYARLAEMLPNLDVFVAKYEATESTKHLLKPLRIVREAFEAGHPFV